MSTRRGLRVRVAQGERGVEVRWMGDATFLALGCHEGLGARGSGLRFGRTFLDPLRTRGGRLGTDGRPHLVQWAVHRGGGGVDEVAAAVRVEHAEQVQGRRRVVLVAPAEGRRGHQSRGSI